MRVYDRASFSLGYVAFYISVRILLLYTHTLYYSDLNDTETHWLADIFPFIHTLKSTIVFMLVRSI